MAEAAVLLFWWVLFVGVGAVLGEKLKGRRTAGAALGLLGPVGWLALVAFEDQRPRCPECRSPVFPGARRCARCSVELEA